jgi:hypothetical protein
VLLTARDKREDAKIRDERDERDPRFYEVVRAVDITAEDIVPGSWRHTSQTFGIDFTRPRADQNGEAGARPVRHLGH